MFEIIISLSVAVSIQIFKEFVYPKFGELGVQVSVFAMSLIASGIWLYGKSNPAFMDILIQSGSFLVQAIAWYELILKKMPVFKTSKELSNDI